MGLPLSCPPSPPSSLHLDQATYHPPRLSPASTSALLRLRRHPLLLLLPALLITAVQDFFNLYYVCVWVVWCGVSCVKEGHLMYGQPARTTSCPGPPQFLCYVGGWVVWCGVSCEKEGSSKLWASTSNGTTRPLPPSLHALFTVTLTLAAPALRVQDVLGRIPKEVAKHAEGLLCAVWW